MSHAGATEGIKLAVRNGVRSIEHGDFLNDGDPLQIASLAARVRRVYQDGHLVHLAPAELPTAVAGSAS
jgi:hypothetical protein